jgi:hypothetical protein
MRQILKKLATCKPHEKEQFGEIAGRILDAMIGIEQ